MSTIFFWIRSFNNILIRILPVAPPNRNKQLSCQHRNKQLSCQHRNKQLSCQHRNKQLSCQHRNKQPSCQHLFLCVHFSFSIPLIFQVLKEMSVWEENRFLWIFFKFIFGIIFKKKIVFIFIFFTDVQLVGACDLSLPPLPISQRWYKKEHTHSWKTLSMFASCLPLSVSRIWLGKKKKTKCYCL